MKLLPSRSFQSLVFLSSLLSAIATPDTPPKDTLSPCVARSPTTGLYYDLSAISLTPPDLKEGEKTPKGVRDESWHAKGYDHPANFTINICAPVLEDVTNVEGVESSRWENVSAYYELDGKNYSIGYVLGLYTDTLLLLVKIQQLVNHNLTANKPPILSSEVANSS